MKIKKINFSKIEKKWQNFWFKNRIYEPDFFKAKKPFYNLMMFPYPSADGLHVGNMYAFVGSDIYGRYKRMQGFDVFEPIGLDGFGIHSENYALKINRHPAKQAKISQKRFYQQLKMIGNSFSFEEKLETYDTNYYKFTQWLFIELFKKGLAYRKKAEVNWCPSCKTVLADEQVINGKCERCSSNVLLKELEQWFLKITKYADKLLRNLEKIDWTEKVKIAQKNWIGKSEGVLIKFEIKDQFKDKSYKVEVFTTRPDTLAGVTFLIFALDLKLISYFKDSIINFDIAKKFIRENKNLTFNKIKEKRGLKLEGIYAINPLTKEKISIWLSNYVLISYGTGIIMAVPAHDQRDFEFALKFNLPIKVVICSNYLENLENKFILNQAYEGEGYLINSLNFSGLESKKAKDEIIKWLEKEKIGKRKINYRLRDWLISRQRYWGVPIPLIFCQYCKKEIEKLKKEKSKKLKKYFKGEIENPGWFALNEKDLPVILPYIKNFKPLGIGKAPLATYKKFYYTNCPNCGKKAIRETDVCDTFLDSSWYYFGYLLKYLNWKSDFKCKKFQKLIKKWLPVNMYIGGAEHAVLHLLYVRFISMFLKDAGYIDFKEPFLKFRAHGLLIKEGKKMSKSKGNVVNPDEYIEKFGVDTLRMYLMFLAPFEEGGDFRDSGILGISRFLQRIWSYFYLVKIDFKTKPDINLVRLIHKTIKKVSHDIENLRYNTAISALMILFNELEKNKIIYFEILEIFLKLLAPFAPYLSEELWFNLGKKNSIHLSNWPKYNKNFLKENFVKIIVQLNGKTKAEFEIEKNISQIELEKLILKDEKISKILVNKKIIKVIYIPNKVINFVICES